MTVLAENDLEFDFSAAMEADATHCRTAINSVATANSPRKHIAMVNLAKNPEYEITKEEHDANARLIAAAPEMLAALRWLENGYDTREAHNGWVSFSSDDFEKVRRAIKLAMEG